ncbi:GNAT family N-acetyltransferase [Halomonas stenophila]|uniref:Ribosomal protein S18 acetylase RimI-like enzyme n=1 Tax=Halomonas stenophila TaxID=795312 RepID=A0A7W5EWE0_9GAMM|nr:N-acetyltransferase [Halomonas stenophila]MBB3232035.1 ribosomal protein S18 acetylase RimI-like enzyme [Halomonas stenophila]
MELRAAEPSDLLTVLSWVSSRDECLMWGGPKIRYPATPETAWSDMEASKENTYVLVDATLAGIGFGQVLPRCGKILHLARLIVDPGLRGQGIGRDLCIALMNIGAARHHADWFTLNVYESNEAAVKLYRSLEFEVKEQDDSGAVAMIQPLINASTLTDFSANVPKPAG